MKTGKLKLYPLIVLVLSALGYVRIFSLHDVYLDDNCWLLSSLTSSTLQEFLANGFSQLRREPLGAFLYTFFLPYRLISDYALHVWHGVTLAVQIATPLVLYGLVREVTGGRRGLAAFIAITFVATTLDQTAPIMAAINYRIGLLLGLVSLYLTARALEEKNIGRMKLALALITGGIGEYIFIEGVIAFEPARFFLLWSARQHPGIPTFAAIKLAFIAWIPFITITIPLIIYKLLLKPYGVYTGMYPTDFEHFTDWRAAYAMFDLLSLGHWRSLQEFSAYAAPTTIALAITAGTVAFFALLVKQARRCLTSDHTRSGMLYPGRDRMQASRLVVYLGIILLASQIAFFGFAGRFPSVGDRTTYAVLMQPGYAMIAGAGAWWFINEFLIRSLNTKPFLPLALFALLVGAGTYYTNLNLDLYAAATARGNGFWQAFTSRFPSLPEKADFFVDAASPPYVGGRPTFFGMEGLHGACGYELRLNLLYPVKNDAGGSRRYRAIPVRRFAQDFKRHGPSILHKDLVLTSNFGTNLLHPSEFIVIFYRDGELLVNREILERYPETPYRPWADKPVPAFVMPRTNNAR